MATRKQVQRFNNFCKGGFLPEFDMKDGGVWNNVEFWSGGFQLFGGKQCGVQRIVDMRPEKFSRHLMYHSSNNKQFTINGNRMVEIEGMYKDLIAFWDTQGERKRSKPTLKQ